MTCELCGADLPAQVEACPACGRTTRNRRSATSPATLIRAPEGDIWDLLPDDEAPRGSAHPSLEFAFAKTADLPRSPQDGFDPFAPPLTASDLLRPIPETEERAALDGRVLGGRYLIQELIGEGGMGQVFSAHHLQLDRTVCVKVLRPGLESDRAVVRRFEREARSASRLHHPNSIQVLDFGIDQGSMFLAMEFVDGKTLTEILHKEFPLPEERICHIVAQVLAALAEAHAAQIVHRDLKPDNIMVSQLHEAPDFVKVLDFGIAKILESDDNLTAADMLCGTPQYMSPEQASGRPYDGRADLYSVGVILYQLVTGDVPFNGRNPLEVLSKSQTQAPMPIHERRPGTSISPELNSLIMRALAKNPDARPQTAEVFRRELIRIAETARTRAATPPELRRPAVAAAPTPAPAEPTMLLDYTLSSSPDLRAQEITGRIARDNNLPRVGEAMRYELADVPKRAPKRARHPSVESNHPPARWPKRLLLALLALVVLGIGVRVFLMQPAAHQSASNEGDERAH